MNLLSWGYIVVAAVCVAVAVQHLMIAARLRERRAYVLFALTSLAAGVDALVQRGFIGIRTPQQAEWFFAWSAVSICAFLGFLVWFLDARTAAVRRWLLWTVTGLLVATATIDFLLPSGMPAFIEVADVRDVVLPWGESIRVAQGTPSPWRLIGDAANLGFLALLLDTTIRLARRREIREAALVGGSLAAVGLTVLAIIPADLGWIELPTLHSFAFLLIVAGMSWDLSDRVARATILSREVIRGESRWRQLMENAPFLMVLIDRQGKFVSVNPQYEKTTGRRSEEVLGRPVLEFIPERDRERAESAFREAMTGRARDEYEGTTVSESGDEKTVIWRSVVLRGEDGEPEGFLSLGADVTERRNAEIARDEARRNLERSVRDLENLRQRLEEENLILRETVGQEGTHSSLIGSSPALNYVLHKVRHVAPTGATVLLAGETGVGKELVARMIHRESQRSAKPFVAVNCAALPAGLIESELFGHERGAFTGAERMRRGRFELAHGGTLFLDEISELPLEQQSKLLRVLQEGQIERVGGDRTLDVDVRIVAATNRKLDEEIAAGRFRQDLFYRLDVFPITVPPLRDRVDDIPALATHFVGRISAREGIQVTEIPQEVLRHLARHSWPGNVRELQNVIERAVLGCSDGILRLIEPLAGRPARSVEADQEVAALRPTLEELQRDYIRQILRECRGQIAGPGGAAEVLGVHSNTLRSRMQKLGIAVTHGPPRPEREANLDH